MSFRYITNHFPLRVPRYAITSQTLFMQRLPFPQRQGNGIALRSSKRSIAQELPELSQQKHDLHTFSGSYSVLGKKTNTRMAFRYDYRDIFRNSGYRRVDWRNALTIIQIRIQCIDAVTSPGTFIDDQGDFNCNPIFDRFHHLRREWFFPGPCSSYSRPCGRIDPRDNPGKDLSDSRFTVEYRFSGRSAISFNPHWGAACHGDYASYSINHRSDR